MFIFQNTLVLNRFLIEIKGLLFHMFNIKYDVLSQTLCCDEQFFWIEYSFVFLRSICFCVAMYANNSLESHILLPYFLLKSFIRIYIETWNLSFCFQCCLFIVKSVIVKLLLQYLDFFFFFFLIYEINAVVSIHGNAFYSATSALKMLYVNFFWPRFVTICLLCKFFIH